MFFMKFWSCLKWIIIIRDSKNKFLVWCPISDVWCHSQTSFWYLSLILPLNWCFKLLNLVSRKIWSWSKLFNTVRGTFWILFYIMPHICHNDCITWLPFQALRKVWLKLFNMTFHLVLNTWCHVRSHFAVSANITSY